MQADPSAQQRLLDVQALDTRADTLRHRLATLPEAEKVRDIAQRRQQMEGTVRDLRILVSDLTSEQRRADADVEQVRTRQQRDQGMVDSGQISDPKALERMLGELQSLRRRIGDLEDVELEVMERLESAETDLAARQADLDALADDEQQLRSELAQVQEAVSAELAETERARAPLAAELPADLLALYERLRTSKGGTGAALLRRRECEGCRLTLNAADLAVIAATPPETVVRCEECDRILVRTEESGL
ncbi:zinc ribbon domain-containing protein [Nocardioides aequoreus]|uniref:zinc ribbon domain-containing protein n=1 Tax=Nocardioides aequoreus TaxID=397278 RepID=UPI0004C42E73|nr:C4-type zinc ribbon domain-containing protein [Nocardioides aequoreus]